MPVREGTGAQGIRWNSVNRDRNHRWFVGRYAAFSLPPSPGRVDILEDLSRSLSFSLFPRRRVNYPAPHRFSSELQLICCDPHLTLLATHQPGRKRKRHDCIPIIDYNEYWSIDENRSARAFVFEFFISHRDRKIVLNFEATKKICDGEKNKSSEKPWFTTFSFLLERKIFDSLLTMFEPLSTTCRRDFFLTGILTFRCFLRFNPVSRGASGRQVTKAGTASLEWRRWPR